jgi:hypothetical protein
LHVCNISSPSQSLAAKNSPEGRDHGEIFEEEQAGDLSESEENLENFMIPEFFFFFFPLLHLRYPKLLMVEIWWEIKKLGRLGLFVARTSRRQRN